MNDNPDNAVTENRLRVLIETYGAAPERWPAAERDAARALLSRSAAARQILAQAARLDALLDGAEAPPLPGALERSVRNLSPAPVRTTRRPLRQWFALPGLDWLSGPMLRPAALATAAVLGLAVGLATAPDRLPSSFEPLDMKIVAGGPQLTGVAYLMEIDR